MLLNVLQIYLRKEIVFHNQLFSVILFVLSLGQSNLLKIILWFLFC